MRAARPSSYGQATKCISGMPWHQEAMKDVADCVKLGGAVNRR